MSTASETFQPISWDKMQNLGDIPNTGWFGPDGHGQPTIERDEQVSTDNMQMLLSPEGYHAIELTGPYAQGPSRH